VPAPRWPPDLLAVIGDVAQSGLAGAVVRVAAAITLVFCAGRRAVKMYETHQPAETVETAGGR
jgi:hypothetical protein